MSSSTTTSPKNYRPVGIVLAISSGLFIGTSFVLKKKGLLRSQKGQVAGEGVAYLRSPLWWSGMILMILGELLNLGAYSFVEAIIVTPMGALSVVICAVLSHIVLKERLSLFGWIGCFQCITGSIVIAINAPDEQSVTTIAAFKSFFLAPGFLAYGSVILAAAISIIFFIAPKYGDKTMIWYILVCSLFGGLSVSCTQALGACIVTSIRGSNQFKNWFIYFLLAFVICTLLSEIFFLNKALALFNTAMVTPTYYVIFTFFTLVTSVILYQGLKSSGAKIMTMVLAFLIICSGIFILQMSKVDPRKLNKAVVDEKTSILLEAARREVEVKTEKQTHPEDPEKETIEELVRATEEPGIDALRGTIALGAVGSIVRARRRKTIMDRAASLRSQGSRMFGQSAHSTPMSETAQEIKMDHTETPCPISSGLPSREHGTSGGSVRPRMSTHSRSQILFASPVSTPGVIEEQQQQPQDSDSQHSIHNPVASIIMDAPQIPRLPLPESKLSLPTSLKEVPSVIDDKDAAKS